MRMRRKLVALGIVGLFAACTFPDVSYGPGGDGGPGAEAGTDATQHGDGASSSGGKSDGAGGDDGTSGESASNEGGSSSGGGDDTGTGGDGASSSGGSDSGLSDVGIVDAVNDYVFEAAPDAPVCDKDQDKDPEPGATCGGNDCDDNDPRAYTGEPDFLTLAPTPVTKGDWDCNGVVETEYATSFSCGALNTGACAGASGFKDTPGCGAQSANFITCKVNLAGLLCIVDTTATKYQGCK